MPTFGEVTKTLAVNRKTAKHSMCWRQNRHAQREIAQGAAGQGGHDVRVAGGKSTISGKWVVNSGKCGMDGEVTALGGRLSTGREVKQMMMSVLLGR